MILVLGPSSSGKTTLVKTLLLRQKQSKNKQQVIDTGDLPSVQPTVGTNITSLVYSRKPVEIREVGGCMVPIWKSYYRDADAIIFVIDSSNPQQVSLSCVLLKQVLSSTDTQSIPFLILFNKTDIPTKTSLNELKYLLQLNNIVKKSSQQISMLDVSCKEKTGVDDIPKWILSKNL